MEGLLFLGYPPATLKKAHFAINVTSEPVPMCDYPRMI
jgi:hypothetical protein